MRDPSYDDGMPARPGWGQLQALQRQQVCALAPEFKRTTERLALAVWVTQAGKLIPIQATGGWLPEAQP